MPQEIKQLLNKLSLEFENILGKDFVGFYIHGSLATNCFNIKRSDIDFLVVVNNKLTIQEKLAIKKLVIKSSEETRAVGFDMAVVTQEKLDNLQYPTPLEFYFHYDHMARYNKQPDYIYESEDDFDLAAGLMMIKQRGICWRGKAIEEVIPDVPKRFYLQSIIKDSEWSIGNFLRGPDTGECEVPTYGVLNFCRVIAYIKDRVITSKCEGGEWGLKNLPMKYHFLIKQALNKYSEKKYQNVPNTITKDFALYAQEVIEAAKVDYK